MRKFLIWTIGILATLICAGFGFWEISGYGPAERSAAAYYREFESLGVPLNRADYEASLVIPDEQNCGPKLVKALDAFGNAIEKARFRGASVITMYPEYLVKPQMWAEAEADVAALQKPMDVVRANMGKDHLFIVQDWRLPPTVYDTPAYAYLGSAADFVSTEAILYARAHRQAEASKRLQEAVRILQLAYEQPHCSMDEFLDYRRDQVDSVTKCITLDPDGAPSYVATLRALDPKLFRSKLRHEIYSTMAWFRNEEPTFFGLTLKVDIEGKSIVTEGLPYDRLLRAKAGRYLAILAPVVRCIEPDGTLRVTEKQYAAALVAYRRQCVSLSQFIDRDVVDRMPEIPSLDSPYLRVSEDLARATAQVIEFKNRSGRLPTRIDEIPQPVTDPYSPRHAPFCFRRTKTGFRVWSVGRNQVDNGGLTRAEARTKFIRPTDNDDRALDVVFPVGK